MKGRCVRTLLAPDLQRKQKCVRVARHGWMLGAVLLSVAAGVAARGNITFQSAVWTCYDACLNVGFWWLNPA